MALTAGVHPRTTMADNLLTPWTRSVARAVFCHAGGAAWMRRRFHHSVRILMYHRFPPESRFEAQCAHLRTHYEPVSLSVALTCLRAGETLSENPVVLTVDDGYRDFLQHASPILKRYQIPATVFLTTDLPDRGSWLWVDQVVYCVRRSRVREIALDIGGTRRWTMDTVESREHAAVSIKEAMKRIPNEQRLELLNELPRLLEVELPAVPPDSHAPLHWDEVRTLARDGIEFGAHTRSHPILSRLTSVDELEDEITGSRRRIEREAGVEVRHFCYPNGTPADISDKVVDIVKASGFTSAVTATRGVNRSGADMFRLRRIAVDACDEESSFALAAAGHGISRQSKT